MMRSARPITAAILGLVVTVSVAAAQSRAVVDVDTPNVTVGDRIHATVTVEHPAGTTVEWPDSIDLSPFEVLAAQPPSTVAGRDGSRTTRTLTLTAFELGLLEIPSFDVVVRAADGTEEVVPTGPYGIEVASVGTDEGGDIRDIRGPLAVPMSALRLALLILLPLLLGALLFILARRLRSRGDETPRPAFGALPRPAHEVALEALAALGDSGMLERGEVKEFHIEASDILRRYVEARFRVEALEMTTREVLGGLEAVRADGRFRDGLSSFLEQCDMVKFAKVRPGTDASRELIELGRRLVLDTVPSPEPAPPPGGGGPGGGSRARSTAEAEVAV